MPGELWNTDCWGNHSPECLNSPSMKSFVHFFFRMSILISSFCFAFFRVQSLYLFWWGCPRFSSVFVRFMCQKSSATSSWRTCKIQYIYENKFLYRWLIIDKVGYMGLGREGNEHPSVKRSPALSNKGCSNQATAVSISSHVNSNAVLSFAISLLLLQ